MQHVGEGGHVQGMPLPAAVLAACARVLLCLAVAAVATQHPRVLATQVRNCPACLIIERE